MYLHVPSYHRRIANQWKEIFYLTTHSTHLIYGYVTSAIQIVREEIIHRHFKGNFSRIGYHTRRPLLHYSDRERGNPLPPVGLIFRISSKGSFICTNVSSGALAGTINSLMGPPWSIDPTTHRTMSERSYHGATSRSLRKGQSESEIGKKNAK